MTISKKLQFLTPTLGIFVPTLAELDGISIDNRIVIAHGISEKLDLYAQVKKIPNYACVTTFNKNNQYSPFTTEIHRWALFNDLTYIGETVSQYATRNMVDFLIFYLSLDRLSNVIQFSQTKYGLKCRLFDLRRFIQPQNFKENELDNIVLL